MEDEDADIMNSMLADARTDDTEYDADQDWEPVAPRKKRKRAATGPPNGKSATAEQYPPVILIMDPRPSEVEFARKLRANQRNLCIRGVKLLRNPKELLVIPANPGAVHFLCNINELKQIFENTNIKVRKPLPKQKTDPSFVIVNVNHGISAEDVTEELKINNNIHPKKVSRIISRATGKPTKLFRVVTSNEAQCQAAVRSGVQIGWQKYRCEPSKKPPNIQQCFKCQGFGHFAKECQQDQKCLRCSGNHLLKDCKVEKDKATCSNCGGSHAAVYRGCPAYQEQVTSTLKRSNQTKYSTVVKASNDANLTESITVFIADVVTRFHQMQVTMPKVSYSNIINLVAASAQNSFSTNIIGQQIHNLLERNKQINQTQSQIPQQPQDTNNQGTASQNE